MLKRSRFAVGTTVLISIAQVNITLFTLLVAQQTLLTLGWF